MTNTISKTVFCLIILLTFGNCSSDDDSNSVNQAPSEFQVMATAHDTGLGINLTWSAAIDPEGEAVTYQVLMEGNSQAQDLTTLSYTMEGPGYHTMTNGMVIATDPQGASTQTIFEVVTSSLVDIPDAGFETFLVFQGIDTDVSVNQQMHYTDAVAILELNIPFILGAPAINSIEGIEAFTNLKVFIHNNGVLTSVDFSKNTALEKIQLFANQLTEIDLSQNTALLELDVSSNQLSALDLSANTLISELGCGNNQLTTLNVNHLSALTVLSVYGNGLTELETSNNNSLVFLNCSDNSLSTLDVSLNQNIELLGAAENNISSINFNNNEVLRILDVNDNQLTELDLSQAPFLEEFSGASNQFSTLDFSTNVDITKIHCSSNGLQTLDLRNGNVNLIDNFDATQNPDLIICMDAFPNAVLNNIDDSADISFDCD